jgi:hypothetical protein
MTSQIRHIAVAGIGAVALSSGACAPRDLNDVGRCAGDAAERFEEPEREEGPEGRITVPATDVIQDRKAFGVQGAGSDYVGAVDITWGHGAIDLGCREVPLVVTTAFRTSSGHAVVALAVDGEAWYPIVFTCGSGGNLDWIEYGSTNGARMTSESARGRCQLDSDRTKEVTISLPATDMAFPRLLGGYEILGPEISLRPGVPGMLFGGYPLLAFAARGETPVHWIHAIIQHAAGSSYAFLILDERASEVTVYDSTTLPDLQHHFSNEGPLGVTHVTTP